MRRFTFRDLKDEHEFLELRSTSLGSFSTWIVYPSTSPIQSNETTYFGDMIHAIVLTTLQWGKEAWRLVMEEIREQISDFEYYHSKDNYKKFHKNIENYWRLACDLYDNELTAPVLCIEREYRLLLECSWYLVCMWGCLDCILQDWVMIDIKTSTWLWDSAKEVVERQQYYYTLLRNWSMGIHTGVKTFKYAVFTKHSPPRLQVITKQIDLEYAERLLKADLQNYLKHKHEDKMKEHIQDGNIDTSLQDWLTAGEGISV